MNKLVKICNLLNILKPDELQELENIQIIDEKRTSSGYVFSLLLPYPFSPSLFNKVQYIEYEGIKIKTNIVAVKNADTHICKQYLINISESYPNLKLFKKNIEANRFEFLFGARLISFKYCIDAEKDEINSILKIILETLKSAFGLSNLDFEFIEDEDFKQKIINKKETSKKILDMAIKEHEEKQKTNNTVEKNDKDKINRKNIIDLESVIDGMTNINVEGEVFKVELKENSKLKTIKIFIHDYNSTLVIKYNIFKDPKFQSKSNLTNDVLQVKEGDWIIATIDAKTDQYEIEMYGNIKKINIIKKPSKFLRQDDAIEKRIELTCHSKMSAYDGVSEVSEIVGLAKQFNWEAIALTDRYNLQSFPEFQKETTKHKIKPIYGVEMCVLPSTKIVLNDTDKNLDKLNYIIFDLETTGLNPAIDDIIEFGAIKYENGIKVDSIQFFIKPNVPISDLTTELTGITNEHVKDAINQEEGIKKILSFISDSALIAHNAINFDFRFLCTKAETHVGINLENTVIDTLHIVRCLYPSWQNHTLEKTCKELKIPYGQDEAHRADYDANVLNSCWLKIMEQFGKLDIKKVSDINLKLSSSKLKAKYQSDFTYIYPKNYEGLKKLNELVSISHTSNFFGEPKISSEILEMNRKDLIIAPSPIEGEVWRVATCGTNAELKKVISKYDYIFIASPENFYPYIKTNSLTLETIQKLLKKIITYSYEQNKKVIAVSDAYYTNDWDKKFQEVYLYVKGLNGKRHRYYRYKSLPNQFIRNTIELKEEFAFLNNQEIIDAIVVKNSHLFNQEISNDIKPVKDGLFAPKMDNVDELLTAKVYETAKEIYGDTLPNEVQERLTKELNSIISNKFTVVYWISHLLVKKSYDDGYTVGSRGSVGSSLVATMLKITDVNPLPPHYICQKCKYTEFVKGVDDGFDLIPTRCCKCGGTMYGEGHDIPFETFLGFKGDKVPDIDLNFSGVYQPKAHLFIREIFGKDHAFRAGTISTVAEKTCFALVKEYFDETKQTMTKNSTINLFTKKCENVKRTTGQHPGGILIVPKEYSVYDFTPFNYPADDLTSDWYTTHYAFEYLHDNLLKFDILGHDNPTILKKLKDITGISESDIPNYDPNVLKLFTSPEPLKIDENNIIKYKNGAISIPEFGTKFVREMLDYTQPKSFADLIRISGLSHGTNVYLGNAQELIKNNNLELKDVIGCRDDIMIYLIKKGIDPSTSFKIMEDVRKGKKLKDEYIKIMKENKVPEWYIDSCNKIEYMFPKAHATAYVMHAWKFAWYKIYKPLAYYSVFLSAKTDSLDMEIISKGKERIKARIDEINSLSSNKETANLVKKKDLDSIPILEVCLEMASRGIKINKPDIFISDATEFIIHNNEIVAPFSCVDGIGKEAAQSIINARNEKVFTCIDDVVERTKLNKTNIAKLKELGSFDNLPSSGQMSLFEEFV